MPVTVRLAIHLSSLLIPERFERCRDDSEQENLCNSLFLSRKLEIRSVLMVQWLNCSFLLTEIFLD